MLIPDRLKSCRRSIRTGLDQFIVSNYGLFPVIWRDIGVLGRSTHGFCSGNGISLGLPLYVFQMSGLLGLGTCAVTSGTRRRPDPSQAGIPRIPGTYPRVPCPGAESSIAFLRNLTGLLGTARSYIHTT